MPRKKWTPQEEVTGSLIAFREKRKWQIALRRYVLEKNKSSFYAPFFGLGIETFRKWIEAQFDEETNWDNFSQAWQFDHIVPIAYFDFDNDDDMKLCWNFTNIRVAKVDQPIHNPNKVDMLAAIAYFQSLFEKTQYPICLKMAEKLEKIRQNQLSGHEKLEKFIQERKFYLDVLYDLPAYYFDKLNTGTPIGDIKKEIEFLQKFEKKD